MQAIKTFLLRLTQAIVVIMLLTIVVVLSAQIVARYLFEAPLVWSEELVLILLLWITFLGSALCLNLRGHISIDFVVQKMPEHIQRAAQLFTAILMVVFCAVLVYGGWLMIQATSGSITPGLKVSVAWHYGGTLVGGALMLLSAIEHLVSCIRYAPMSTKPATA